MDAGPVIKQPTPPYFEELLALCDSLMPPYLARELLPHPTALRSRDLFEPDNIFWFRFPRQSEFPRCASSYGLRPAFAVRRRVAPPGGLVFSLFPFNFSPSNLGHSGTSLRYLGFNRKWPASFLSPAHPSFQ